MESPESSTAQPDPTESSNETVTLMMTDIEGSTQLLESLGAGYPRLLFRARELLKAAVTRHGGDVREIEGDAVFAVFADASDAVVAAVDAQLSFHAEPWPSNADVRVRIGLHTGQPRRVGDSYFGLDVHRTARITAAASGAQVVLSAATRAHLRHETLPPHLSIRDLGSHRLKDLRYPEVLFDLEIPGLVSRFGSLRSLDAQPNNLPSSPNRFIGRQHQIVDVRNIVLRSDTRLLTLTGAGGTGKTRLAIETAQGLLGSFPHGVFLVPLASVSDADLLAMVTLQTLGLPDFGNKAPLESLIHHLAKRRMLLVLDNFEHLMGAATQVVALLNACPGLKILATSREPLNLRSEKEYRVGPLPVPETSAATDVDSLQAVESVRLFVERVQDYDQHFAVATQNAAALSGICRRLDGLPLALELAASWIRLYTPQALLTRLQDSIDLLRGGAKDLAGHQHTLKDTIAWSYKLLKDDEQTVFRRLSVFAGGCTLDSAVSLASDRQTDTDIMDAVMSLVRKSLVTQTSVEGQTRIGMLETIRQFAIGELELTPEDVTMRRRHAEHYLALAERMAPGLTGRQQRLFVTPLMMEQDNLRSALTWAIQQRQLAITSRSLTALLWLWIPRGQFTEGRRWATRALEAFTELGDVREVALIREAAGWLEVLAGDYPAALPQFERAYNVFANLPDVKEHARASVTLGVTCLVLGDERGLSLSDEALKLALMQEDKTVLALARLCVGIRHQVSGNAADAAAFYSEALETFYQADNVFWPGQVLQNLARLRLEEEDYAGAMGKASEALEIGREFNYPMIRNLSLAVMGGIARKKGDAMLAARLFGAVRSSLSELGVTFEPPEQGAMDEDIQAIHSLLDAESCAAAFDEGRWWQDPDILSAVRSFHAGCRAGNPDRPPVS